MKNKTMRTICAALTFSFAMVILGPYQYAGISAMVLAVLLAGVALEPLYAVLSVAVYLGAGIWLPVYPGGGSGTATLLGARGGFLLALIPCVLVISALIKGLRKKPILSVVTGLGMAFLLYFCIGILWYVVKTDSSLTAVLNAGWGGTCLLFAFDCILAFLAAGPMKRAVR
ncbi:MAG: biotin transporter BioY [Clostridia bacterium]|nr:biotin transporter BioY [Clostridia bacterium]MBO7157019.1 biotin transporter BioY [Clostridia bacterium]